MKRVIINILQQSLFISLTLLACHLQAQNPAYYQLSTEAGLPSNTVYDVIEDQKGFIWIGCDAGLFRYNGVEYEQYTHPNLKAGGITDIVESPDGIIYAVNFDGQLIRLENRKIIKVWETDNSSIRHSTSYHLVFDKYNNLWGGITDRWLDESVMSDTWTLHENLDSCLGQDTLSFGYDYTAHIAYFATFLVTQNNEPSCSGLYYDEWSMNEYFHTSLWQDSVYTFVQSLEDKVYVRRIAATEDCQITYDSDSLLMNALRGKMVNTIIQTKNKEWYLTNQGCIVHDIKLGSISTIFENVAIQNFVIDKAGGYWLVTTNNKLLYSHNTYMATINNPIQTEHITLAEDSILYFYDEQHKVQRYSLKNQVLSSIFDNVDNISLLEALGTNVYFSEKGFLYKYNQTTGELSQLDLDLPMIYDMDTMNKHLMFSTSYAINVLEDSPMLFDGDSSFLVDNIKRFNPKNRYLYALSTIPDKDMVWSGGRQGLQLYRYNQDTTFKRLQDTLSDHIFMDFAKVNKSDTLYALTRSGQIFKLEGLNSRLLFKIEQKHLIANHLSYQAPYLGITTNQGLYVYNEKTAILEHFTILDGLVSNELHDIELIGNTIWLATSKGLQSLPFPIPKRYVEPLIYLDKIWINDSLFSLVNVPVQLSHKDKLQIDLEAVAYSSQQSYLYAYRLLPHDTTWTYIKATSPQIIQERLPSGAFTLECHSVSHEGIWSSRGLKVNGFVTAPYWQRWWFYLLSGGVVAILALLISRSTIQRIKARQDKELAMLDEMRLLQLKTIRSQMNPHFTFNVLNSIQSYIYKNDKQKASQYLNQFSVLMRKVLDASNQETVLLAEELELLKLYISLEAMQMPKDFESEIYIADDIDPEDITLPLLLVQPYVENAIKHGLHHKVGHKKLYLGLEWATEDVLQITIEDNGIGRAAAAALNNHSIKPHKSFATKANEKRLKLVNKQEVGVEIIDKIGDNQKALGTRVVLKVNVAEV